MVQAFVYQFQDKRPNDMEMPSCKLIAGTVEIMDKLWKCSETHHNCVGCPKTAECQKAWDKNHTEYEYRKYGKW